MYIRCDSIVLLAKKLDQTGIDKGFPELWQKIQSSSSDLEIEDLMSKTHYNDKGDFVTFFKIEDHKITIRHVRDSSSYTTSQSFY